MKRHPKRDKLAARVRVLKEQNDVLRTALFRERVAHQHALFCPDCEAPGDVTRRLCPAGAALYRLYLREAHSAAITAKARPKDQPCKTKN